VDLFHVTQGTVVALENNKSTYMKEFGIGIFTLLLAGVIYNVLGNEQLRLSRTPQYMVRDSSATLSQSAENSFAVVELFTSQGCSSCPPADRVLANLVDQAAQTNRPVYALSFHVDYWNYIGWKDPYSDAVYTARQRQYDDVLGSRMYTPQMIVNGEHAFVGSQAREADRLIQQALDRQATYELQLDAALAEDTASIEIAYQTNASSTLVLNLALVQATVSDQVERGENRGRKLEHSHVVRTFLTMDVSMQKGIATLEIPKGVDPSQLSLIGYIQDPQTMQIHAASDAGWAL